MLAVPKHQEINGQVEVTWRTLCTVAHSLMAHARFSVRKATAHIETKALNMRQQAPKRFRSIFVGIPEH